MRNCLKIKKLTHNLDKPIIINFNRKKIIGIGIIQIGTNDPKKVSILKILWIHMSAKLDFKFRFDFLVKGFDYFCRLLYQLSGLLRTA